VTHATETHVYVAALFILYRFWIRYRNSTFKFKSNTCLSKLLKYFKII